MITQKQLHERLWAAAEQLRANGELKLNEIDEPILGLIFLKFADVKFRQAKQEIDVERAKASVNYHEIFDDSFQAAMTGARE